jgi:hypothetical protein
LKFSYVVKAGTKAAVLRGEQSLAPKTLAEHLGKLRGGGVTFDALDVLGEQLGILLLPSPVLALLGRLREQPLLVVHDELASRIPWEAVHVAGRPLAAGAGLSRLYAVTDIPLCPWLTPRPSRAGLSVLLVVNPTEDLEQAEKEGRLIWDLLGATPSIRPRRLLRGEATKSAMLAALRSGEFDAVHYAGHAFFDATDPGQSGIRCHNGEVLKGDELGPPHDLPNLIFLNACETARIRRDLRPPASALPRDLAEGLRCSRGIAEVFLRGGIANYVGTYWPVGDAAAGAFAAEFYRRLVGGHSIGQALAAGRKAVRDVRSVDWANYIHYGSHDFVLRPA